MVSRSLSVLAALIPALAFANAVADENPVIPRAELETWSDEQLCRAREIREALDELERREIFDGRELRAIRRDNLRTHISEDALRCMKGSPRTIVPAVKIIEGDAVDAFVYPQGTTTPLVVYIRRQGVVSTVAGFGETDDPSALVPRSSHLSTNAGIVCSGRGAICVPGTGGSRQHSSARSSLGGNAASPPPPSLPSQ